MKTKWIEVMIIVMAFGLLSLCFATFDNTKPADSDPITSWPGFIRVNNDALEALLGVDLSGYVGDFEVGDINATDIKTISPWIDIRAYGTHTTDIGRSLNLALAALPATGGEIRLPASATAFPLLTMVTISKPCKIVGQGRGATVIEKQADVIGFTIDTATGRVTLEDFTLDSDGSDAGKNGITITQFWRGAISRVEVTNQSNHGIEFLKGNASSFRDLMLISNGGDGLKVNASDVNCNVCVYSNIDTKSNTGWGFNIEDGNENWCIGITAQFNGNGIRVNGYGNVLYIYAENNTTEQAELTAASQANTVHSILPSSVTVGGVQNLVYDRGGGLNRPVANGASFIGGLTSGDTDHADAGFLTLWEGGGGNTPGYIKIHSPDGSVWYLFIENDGTLKRHNAVPTLITDGTAIGDQTD